MACARFKREAVQLWKSSGKSAATIERDLGITYGLLYKWARKLNENGQYAFPGKGVQTPEQERIRRLERENEILRQEREILKKAVAITSTSLSTGFTNPKR